MNRAVTCMALTVVAAGLLSGCATIMGKSDGPVVISSQPDGADISIVNRAGQTVFTGHTPTTVNLKGGAGYFKSEVYKVSFAREGYAPREAEIEHKVNGWYIGGNFVFGGLIGYLVVDPLTGAMWKMLDLHVDLEEVDAPRIEGSLNILQIEDVPEDVRAYLIPLN